MRRTFGMLFVTLAVGLSVFALAGAGAADELPRHPHMFVLGLQLDENEDPIAYRKCVDIAGNRRLPLKAHHAHLHTGRAGEAQWQAGNAVVPGAPLTPWANCEELIAEFFPS